MLVCKKINTFSPGLSLTGRGVLQNMGLHPWWGGGTGIAVNVPVHCSRFGLDGLPTQTVL